MTDTITLNMPRSWVEQALRLLEALSDDDNYDYSGCFQHWHELAQPEDLASQLRAALEQPQVEQEPDWTNSETGLLECWKNPMHTMPDRLQMADGAVAFRDKTIANLRLQLAAYKSAQQLPAVEHSSAVQPKVEQKPETWQPIETAPKGRIVLVHYKNRLGNGRTMRARYYLEDTLDSDTTESGWADEGWYEESEAYEYLMPLDGDPTHWMPLPPSPGSAQDAISLAAEEAAAEASKDSRAPMPEEVIRIMCKQPWLFETVQQWVRIVERYHNIGKFVKPGESSGD